MANSPPLSSTDTPREALLFTSVSSKPKLVLDRASPTNIPVTTQRAEQIWPHIIAMNYSSLRATLKGAKASRKVTVLLQRSACLFYLVIALLTSVYLIGLSSATQAEKRCLIAGSLSFSIEGFSPPCAEERDNEKPHCQYEGQVFSDVELFSQTIGQFYNADIVQLKVYGVPCRKSGRMDVTCCDRDVFIRPKATDFAVMVQILFHLEFGFLLGTRDSISHGSFLPSKIEYILDAGGNCGLSALFFASIFPDATVVTVESNPDNFQVLQRNTKGFSNIIPVNKGIWSKSAFLQVVKGSRHGREWDSQVVETAEERNSIPATSISDLLRELNLSHFDVIKMDIEGSEKEVFEAADVHVWLSHVKVFLAELHPDMREGSDTAVHHHLRQSSFHEFAEGEYEVYVRNPSLNEEFLS